MHNVVYNTPLYHLLFLSVLYSMYIIIKLLSYYYYLIIIFFPHERSGLHDPILVPNKPNIIIIIVYHIRTILKNWMFVNKSIYYYYNTIVVYYYYIRAHTHICIRRISSV